MAPTTRNATEENAQDKQPPGPPRVPSQWYLLDFQQVEGLVRRCCYLSSLVSIDVNREAIILESKLLCDLKEPNNRFNRFNETLRCGADCRSVIVAGTPTQLRNSSL